MKVWAALIGAIVIVGGVTVLVMNRQASPEAELADRWAMIDQYCLDCHNDAEFTGGLSFEGMAPSEVLANPGLFEDAIHKLNIGAMPPRDVAQPDPEVKAQFVSALVNTLDAAARENPYASTTKVHRLNRTETLTTQILHHPHQL